MKLWEVAAKRGVGKPPAFKSPQEMLERAFEYFEWCATETMDEDKLFAFQGVVTRDVVQHKRPFTQAGLCIFLGIGYSTWHDYKSGKAGAEEDKLAYSEVIKQIENIMYENKFSGASVGLFNANIIARDLGLKDKTETDLTSSDGSFTGVPTRIELVAPDVKG